jgi:hypothetical protein
MPRYLISFDDGSMDHITEEDLPAVGESAHAVVRKHPKGTRLIFVDSPDRHPVVLPRDAPDGCFARRNAGGPSGKRAGSRQRPRNLGWSSRCVRGDGRGRKNELRHIFFSRVAIVHH